MAIRCYCPSCGVGIKVDEKFAGCKATCPKCSGTIVIPQPDTPAPPPLPEETVDEFPSIITDAPSITDSPNAADSDRASASSSSIRKPRKAGNRGMLIAVGVAAALLVGVLGTVAAVNLFSGGGSDTKDSQAAFVLEWPRDDRSAAAVFIDGNKARVPSDGPVEYRVKPGKHRIVLVRRGFEQIELGMAFEAGGRHHYTPVWVQSGLPMSDEDWPQSGGGQVALSQNQPDASDLSNPTPTAGAMQAGFDDWLQDVEAAKRQAAAEGKDILIAFNGSDWCGWSIRLAYEVFFQGEFREQIKWSFVLVNVDFPHQDEAKSKVQDAARNDRLRIHYKVSGLPTVVLADAEGRPYARQGYVEGVNAFVESVVLLQSIRDRRDALFAKIEAAQGQSKLEAVEEALAFLDERRLVLFYRSELAEWAKIADQHDPDNQRGLLEAVFSTEWLLRLISASENDPKQVPRIAAELEEWTGKRKFHDPDRAASLYLLACGVLAMTDQTDQATRYAERGLACQPKDPMILAQLRSVASADYHHAAGTGFVVSSRGHVLTNHHVIEDENKISVRLPDHEAPLPARIVAQDAEQDVAILKIDVPDGVKLNPIAISDRRLGRGAEVAAFGFPMDGTVGSGLKLTRGVVSSTADQSPDGMLLLDCRVNPGNSGGPLCDSRGDVVGMVTAKSLSGFGVDSYGMAIPGDVLRDFLGKHLPSFETGNAGQTEGPSLPWDQIDQRVSPSVLMIVTGG